jgi:hypothetical protein
LNSSGKERGEVFCFQRLAKALIGADSKEVEDAPLAAYIGSHQSFILIDIQQKIRGKFLISG